MSAEQLGVVAASDGPRQGQASYPPDVAVAQVHALQLDVPSAGLVQIAGNITLEGVAVRMATTLIVAGTELDLGAIQPGEVVHFPYTESLEVSGAGTVPLQVTLRVTPAPEGGGAVPEGAGVAFRFAHLNALFVPTR